MPKLKHAHTYEKMKTRPNYFRCIHPDCTHFTSKEHIVGKKATCVCGALFILRTPDLRLKRPHCENCGKSELQKERIALRDKLANKFMNQLFRPELVTPEEAD